MATKRTHVMTPARKAALRKAQLASVRARRIKRASRNRGHAPKRSNRGEGFTGLKKNFIPYVRVNKRSQTIGYNTGTIVTGSNSRVVYGSYVRRENINKKNGVDKRIQEFMGTVAPKNTRRGKARAYVKKNVVITNPAVRAKVRGGEVRLSTSRGAGPTIVVRRGRHKVSEQASRKAIKRYDTHARKLHAKRQGKPRPQRRKASR